MRILLNERPLEVEEALTVGALALRVKPGADVLVVNGFPASRDVALREGDAVVLIRRGEVPTAEELDAAMAARHSPAVHERLKRARVGIAGCGGLGSTVAVALARVGTGTLVLVDFDVVEPSNLNRQQFFVDQIGLRKVDALQANLARVNPLVRVEAHAERLTPENIPALLGSVDVLVEAFDAAAEKSMLVETVQRLYPEKPVVMGLGMAGWGGNHLLHTRDVGGLFVCGDELSAARPGNGLMAPRVGVVAHLQANQVLEILLGVDPALRAAQRGEGPRA